MEISITAVQIAGVAGQTEKPHQTLYDFQVTASQGQGDGVHAEPPPPNIHAQRCLYHSGILPQEHGQTHSHSLPPSGLRGAS